MVEEVPVLQLVEELGEQAELRTPGRLWGQGERAVLGEEQLEAELDEELQELSGEELAEVAQLGPAEQLWEGVVGVGLAVEGWKSLQLLMMKLTKQMEEVVVVEEEEWGSQTPVFCLLLVTEDDFLPSQE